MKEAAIFDIDKTLVNGNTGMVYTYIFFKKRYLGILDALKIVYYAVMYKLHRFDYDKGMRAVYSLLKGHNRKEIKKIIDEHYESHVRPKIYDYMIKEIKKQKQKNRVIIFASNSMEEMVEKLSRELGADFLLAAKAEHKNNYFTGNIVEVCFGEVKARRIKELCKRENINLEKSYSYSDHYSDRHMLMITGYPAAVNPDKKLKKVARSRKWKVINI